MSLEFAALSEWVASWPSSSNKPLSKRHALQNSWGASAKNLAPHFPQNLSAIFILLFQLSIASTD
jgi:hypothetical protein